MSDHADTETLLQKAREIAGGASREGDLIAAAVNALAGRLRPASGKLRHTWSCSASSPTLVSVNATLPLVSAWLKLDAPVAMSVVEAAMDLQREDGCIPARFDVAAGAEPDNATAWPLLVQSAVQVWRATRDAEFAVRVTAPLCRYVTWCLKHFHHDGRFAWTSAEEAFIPERFNPGAAAADVTAFLLCEIQALGELAAVSDYASSLPLELSGRRDQLIDSLEGHFWNPETRTFQDRLDSGEFLEPVTLSALLPLLWDGLAASQKKGLLARLCRSRSFGITGPVPHWSSSPREADRPPRRAIHQAIVLEALHRAGAHREAQIFRNAILHRLAEGLRSAGALGDELGQIQPSSAEVAPALAIMCLSGARGRANGDAAAGGKAAAKTRPQLLAVAAGVALLLFAGFATGESVLHESRIRESGLKAERAYAAGDFQRVVALLRPLDRERDAVAEQTLGKALFKLGRLEDAERSFRTTQSLNPQLAQAWLNCALCLFRENHGLEASRLYDQVQEQFATTHPDIAERARIAKDVITAQIASNSR